MIDIIATMTPEEYRTVKAQLQSEDLWKTDGDAIKEARANRRAEQVIQELRK